MKKTLKLTQIFLLFCFSNMSAQNHQPWYADDIYYDTNEKDINYIETEFNDLILETFSK